MSPGMLVLGLILMLVVVGLTLLVILWAREESAKAVGAPFYERAKPGPYHVQLIETGRRKAAVFSLVRRARRVSLGEAYTMVSHPPVTVAEGVSREDAEWLVEQFEEKGARARVLAHSTTRMHDTDARHG